MTTEELNELRQIAKWLGEFAAERRAFITILEELRVSPKTWERRLNQLRETPEYRAIALRYQTIFEQMKLDSSFEALARLVQQLNEGKPPN